MSLANTRARLRMTSLYYFAALDAPFSSQVQEIKWRILGVAFSYTKYGDGGVDLSPIGRFNEGTEVYKHRQSFRH